MNVRKCLSVFAVTAGLSVVFNLQVYATDAADTGVSQHCISLLRIDNIKIIDKQNIVVKTRDDKYFLNHLSHACPNLDEHKAIMYKTPLNRLCSHDIITLLDNIGGGFKEFGACGLGSFKQVSEDELNFIKEGSL